MLQAATHVIRTLRDHGHQALLAGGCVRDFLLGKDPKDYDVATSATPQQVIALFPGALTVGAHFGVVIVKRDGHQIEVATFRTDGSYKDGRRPESVTFATAEEDAQRRDFTINGLFRDPVEDRIIDYVDGQKDLDARLLRAIGDPSRRFAEDRLRLLRAIRFATVLDFEIEPATWQAVCDHAQAITTVSAERIRDELVKIFLHPNRLRGFDLLVDSGLMQGVLPEILVLKGVEQPPQWHPEGDVFIHTRLMLSLLPEQVSLPLVLSVLLHDIAKPATFTVDEGTGRIRFNGHDKLGAEMTGDILRRLKFPNDVIEPTQVAVEHHMAFKDVKKMRNSTLKRMMARPTWEDEMALHRVDCLGSNGLLDNYEFMKEKAEEFSQAPLIPQTLINGRDLIDLGWQPGKVMGAALIAVQNAQLEGLVTTREEALAWIQANCSP
ncbi:poly(A) polymerase [Prosthecobacter fusiformis]|uniref:Poly(A) polymerase n=1 Tax=Prosthecobacter fusiformis TaxID=48464 RepID=A0A4V3FED1_9BACT|nr:CCA tRNA nucleotidyltransferase [Prosthecobacter fusiformis]TDU66533.1 poly(A) polymerase [Prosthecobacter fusiformis]